MTVMAACNISFLKTISYIEVQKYLFGINGLKYSIHLAYENTRINSNLEVLYFTLDD